ncbi:hypothetical protein YSY43_00630 [Paenibacillus sp. YSY-4.3]
MIPYKNAIDNKKLNHFHKKTNKIWGGGNNAKKIASNRDETPYPPVLEAFYNRVTPSKIGDLQKGRIQK